MPRVSVVMPSYQHAEFVAQSVESVLAQSFGDLELLVTDDASVDGTADVVRGFSDPRVNLDAFTENRGAAFAANAGIARAEGDYIAILNSDDYFLPEKLEKQVAILDSEPDIHAVFGLPHLIDERGEPIDNPNLPYARLFGPENKVTWGDKDRHAWLRSFFFNGNGLCHPTAMIRKSVYKALGGYDARLVQLPDFEMWIRICTRFQIRVLETPLTAFRLLDHEQNASGARPEAAARLAWESGRLLEHFRTLKNEDFRTAFVGDLAELEASGPLSQDVALARLALAHPAPSHRAFGLNLLYEAAGAGEAGVSPREFAALSASIDPLGVGLRRTNDEINAEIEFLRVSMPRLFGGDKG